VEGVPADLAAVGGAGEWLADVYEVWVMRAVSKSCALALGLFVAGCGGQQTPTKADMDSMIAAASNSGAGWPSRMECAIISPPGGPQASFVLTSRMLSENADFIQMEPVEGGNWPSETVRFERAQLDIERSRFDQRGQTSEYRRTVGGVEYVFRQSDHDSPSGRGAVTSVLFDGAMRTLSCRDLTHEEEPS
jgi:hypothetical protein